MSLYDCSGFLYVVTPTSHHWRSILLKFFGHIARGDPSMDHSRALRFSVAPLPRDWNRRSGRPHHTRQIPNRCSYLTDCNFLIRMLFADTYWWCFYLYYAFLTLTFNISLFLNCGLSIFQQEAFEKCWAHSRLRAASRPLTRCRYRYCRAPPAHRCPRHQRRQRQRRWQRQRATEGTAMAPWNGPNKRILYCTRLRTVESDVAPLNIGLATDDSIEHKMGGRHGRSLVEMATCTGQATARWCWVKLEFHGTDTDTDTDTDIRDAPIVEFCKRVHDSTVHVYTCTREYP